MSRPRSYNKEFCSKYKDFIESEPPRVTNKVINNWITPVVQIPNVVPDEIFLPIFSSYILPTVINGRYFISNFGRVYDSYNNRYIEYRTDRAAYVRLRTVEGYQSIYIHQLVLYYFSYISNYDQYIPIHNDGNIYNNHLSNLFWGTNSDAHLYGKICKGENVHTAKHEEAKVRKICELLQEGFSNKVVQDLTDSTKSTVEKIKNRKTWKYISKDYTF